MSPPTIVLTAAVVFICLSMCQSTMAARRGTRRNNRPHIVYILADDLGFHDVPWHNPLIHAPALQRLAHNGVTLAQSYMLPVCSPSRAALLTGHYPWTNGIMSRNLKPLQPTGLPLNVTLLPEVLRSLGYTTHMVGKWHLGFCKEEYTPLRRGFDTFRGFYTGSLDYYDHTKGSTRYTRDGEETGEKVSGLDFRDNSYPDHASTGKYSTFEFTSNVDALLRARNPRDPMFLYLALQNPHGPLEVPQKYVDLYSHEGNTKRRMMLGMVSALDAAVQRVVTALKKTNHYKNTIIIFSSDNGGSTAKMGLNWPLRGSKGSLFEGGTRVPALISGSALGQPGTAYQGIFHVTDWFPTLVSAAGGKPPPYLDGVDQWGALRGLQTPPREQFVYHVVKTFGLRSALRYKNYKVIMGGFRDRGWLVPPEYKGINETILTDFLNSGKRVNLAPSRVTVNRDPAAAESQSGSQALHVSDTSIQDVFMHPTNDNEEHYHDDEEDYDDEEEDEEEEEKEVKRSKKRRNKTRNEFKTTQLFSDLGAFLPSPKRRVNNRRRGREELGELNDQSSSEREGKSRKFVKPRSQAKKKMKKLERLQRKKQKKQMMKQSKKKSKFDQRSKKRSIKETRPDVILSEGLQKVTGAVERSLNHFDSAEEIVQSGVPIHLYDLDADPYERFNLATSKPEVVLDLLKRLVPEMLRMVASPNPEQTMAGSPENFDGVWSSGWC